ncbi:MAG: monovalent cation/H(+) antiporter subunit G [Candidatus Micrarchaeota archaeon]
MIYEFSALSLLLGVALCMISVLGVLRMPDFMSRFHASTILVTLGTLFILIPVGLHSKTTGDLGYAKSALILLIATWAAGAVGSHAMARAMFSRGMKPKNLIKDQTLEKP